MVDAFADLVCERLRGDDPAIRKAYVALFVSEVKLDQNQIHITGSTGMFKRAVGKTNRSLRAWCPFLTGSGARRGLDSTM